MSQPPPYPHDPRQTPGQPAGAGPGPQGPPAAPYGHPMPPGAQAAPSWQAPHPSGPGGYPSGPQGYGPQGPQGYGPSGPQGKPKRKSVLKRWWFWVLVVVFLAIVGSCAGTGGGGADPGTTAPDGGGEAAEPGAPVDDDADDPAEGEADEAPPAEEEKSAAVGEAVASGDFEVTVTDVETGVASVGDDLFGAEAQGQFIVVSMEVTNIGDSPVTFFSSDVELTDDEARTYSADDASAIYVEDSNSFLEEINPGNTVDGIVLFDVPEGVEPSTLVFRGGLFDEPIEIALG